MKKSLWKKILLTVLALLILLTAGMTCFMLTGHYRAEPEAVRIAQADDTAISGRYTLLTPGRSNGKGIIFYPGAKVEANAYLPLLDRLRQQGFTCVLVRMPVDFAFFGINAADKAKDLAPDIQHWYLCGHSLGGAMAGSYASSHPDAIDGLILLGAYLYGDYPVERTLTIYGSLNSGVGEKIDYTENIVVIPGGNHAQFGNYGHQIGDADALISADEQQSQTVEAILSFLQGK